MAPRAKNLRLMAKNVVDCTAAWAPDRGPRKAKRGSRRRTGNTVGGRKSLSKREQKSGLNWELSNGNWKWMGSFKTKLAAPRCVDLIRWRITLWKLIYRTNFKFERDDLRDKQLEREPWPVDHNNSYYGGASLWNRKGEMGVGCVGFAVTLWFIFHCTL